MNALKIWAVAMGALLLGVLIGRESVQSDIVIQVAQSAGVYTAATTVPGKQSVVTSAVLSVRHTDTTVRDSTVEDSKVADTGEYTTKGSADTSLADGTSQTETTVAEGTTAAGSSIAAAGTDSTTKSGTDTSTAATSEKPTTVDTTAAATTTATTTTEATTKTTAAGATTTAASGLININTASVALLDTLPGIGEAKAKKIIEYRNAHGKFNTVDELVNVDGIGEKTMANLRPLITVGE